MVAPERWLRPISQRPGATARLICLPHAGGGGNSYRRWAPTNPDIDVLAATLPGRESRIGEHPDVDVDALMEAVWRAADRPYAIFGHSMGGVLAVEITRRLDAANAPLPEQLWLAAAPLPGEPGPLTGAADLPDEALTGRLIALGGVPWEVAADPMLTAMFLPPIRADLRWLDSYVYPEGCDPLPVPIHAIAATDDPYVDRTLMARWARYTGREFSLHVVAGGHFFPYEQPGSTCDLVAAGLRERLALGTSHPKT